MKTSTGLLGIILPAFALLAVGCSLPLVTSTANPDRSRAFVESFMLEVVNGRCEEAFEYFDIDSLVAYGRVADRDGDVFWADVEVADAGTQHVQVRGTVIYRIVTT